MLVRVSAFFNEGRISCLLFMLPSLFREQGGQSLLMGLPVD
jgi:hypothetical protein